MITVRFDLSAFKDREVEGNSLAAELAKVANMPAVASVDVAGAEVRIRFDTDERLTWEQQERLGSVVARADAKAANLQQQRDGMTALIIEHAELFGAGFMGRRKGAALTAVELAETPDAAQRIAEQYIGRSLA